MLDKHFSAVNYATCHEDKEVNGMVGPRILNPGTIGSVVRSKHLRFSCGKNLIRPVYTSHVFSILLTVYLHLQVNKLQFSSLPFRKLVTILTEQSRLHLKVL
jgi:hypothetical protein